MALGIGSRIGVYEIVAPLGAGGMGEVYRARDTRLKRDVALKILPNLFANDPERLARFQREAEVLASLNHPNIAAIYGVEESNGTGALIMELVGGETLAERIAHGPIPLEEVLPIAKQIVEALGSAHEQGIIHRDLKPANVILRPDAIVKVVDFGLAKLTDVSQLETMAAPLQTQIGVLVGTPCYMSPEQAEGKDVDPRSDIFSLGVILYEISTGVRPFAGDSHLEVLSSILRDTPRPITDVNPHLPADLARIVRQCLAKERTRRYPSANALRNELGELHRLLPSNEPIVARDAGWRHASTPTIDSLAVLPFANASGDSDTEYLSDGITETLINRLSQISTLRVVPRSTVFRHKGRDIEPTDLGRQLKVRMLLTGKVSQRGDTLSVQAELVDVQQDAQLWGERFVRRASDIFMVEDEIAQQITEKMWVRVTGEERERLAKRYTDDTDAYHLYLRGQYHWSRRTGPDLLKSVEYFQQAIDRDPDYALPYAGLADAYVVMSAFEAGVPKDLLAKAKAAARCALAIEPDLSEALAELLIVSPWLDRDWNAADEAYRHAMRRQPAYWLAHDHYAMTLAARGRVDEAVVEVRRGQALEPLSLVVHHHVAWMLVLAGRPDEAITECRSALDVNPSFSMAYLWMGLALEQKGLYEDAIASFERAVALKATRSLSIAGAAHAYAKAGRIDEARRRLTQLEQESAARYVEPYAIALIHAALDDDEAALRFLEQGYRDNSFWLGMWVRTDTRLAKIRRNARFQDLLSRLGVA
jgi:serine/threonine protein kinase/tetratricopeptide (TPR) repeat protein